nr:glycoside hydrolase N-terminal domain-containing protein [Microbacterium barkeri]
MAEPIGSGYGHRSITRRTVLQLGGMAAVVPFLPGMIAPSPAAAAVMGAGSEALTAAGPGDALPVGSLRYTAPATAWESQALPIGNGRLGAMMFAGTTEELIQFNENSLWGGLNDYDNALAGQPDSAYDTSITGFGSYRDFGAVRVALGAVTRVTAPGGPYQDSSSGETVAQTYDGRTTTKWCIIGPPSHVIWQAELATPQATASYSLTSANDVPERDPQQWTLSGSDDGAAWTPLDARTGAPFEQRGMTKTYTFANTTAYRFYRLDFVPKAGVSHFQIAEIALAGLSLAPAAPIADYRRSLDPRTGVHESRHSTTGGTMTREALAVRDPDVLAFRYETDDPDGFTAVVSLTSAQGAVTTADAAGARLGFAGEMANRLGYAATLRIADTDGTVTGSGSALRVERASRMTLLLDARTDYRLSAAVRLASMPRWGSSPRPPCPTPTCAPPISRDSRRSWTALRSPGASPSPPCSSCRSTSVSRDTPAGATTRAWSRRSSDTADTCWPAPRGPEASRPICRGSGTTATRRPGRPTTTRTSTSR